MAPAALHRLAFRGEDSAQFFRIASPTVVAATVPLAGGIAVDIGVVFWIVAESTAAAIAAAAISFAIMVGLWIIYPLVRRVTARPAKARSTGQSNISSF
jgi:hypothetical protein